VPSIDFKDSQLRVLKPQQRRYELRDKTGLIVRVEPSGRIVFYSIYRLHKRRRVLKHGEYGPNRLSLVKAREAHAKVLAQVSDARSGDAADPAAQRDVKKAEAKLGDTVSDFAATYLELYAKTKKRSWMTDQRILHKDVLPYIGSFKLKDLTQASVHAVLDRIDRRGAHNQAWQTLKVVRKMLNYALSRGAISTNPAARIVREATYKAKERALSDKELEGLFRALPGLRMQAAVQDLLLFQLLTATRPSEAREARWEEIDLESQRWLIPERRMKMGKEHLVPLTAPVLEILKHAEALGRRGFIFPGEKAGRPFNLQALGHALRRKANKDGLRDHGVAFFTPHDIRRTAATIMRRLGFGLVVDRVLAHAPQSVTDKHYDVHDYEPEKRAALEGLASHIMTIRAKALA
jgi:integrase